jgi:DNA/RNA endonuclease YhcR with UshA esterase domain
MSSFVRSQSKSNLLWLGVVAVGLIAGSLTFARADGPATAPTTAPTTEPAAAIAATDKDHLIAAEDHDSTVEGKVAKAEKSATGKVLHVTFDGADDSKFEAVVFQKNFEEFDKAFDGDFSKAVTGKSVHVTGKLQDYRGHPEIILDKPDQITVVK